MTEFFCPAKIWSGSGALEALRTCRASRVLVVTDRYFSENGTAMKLGSMVPGAEVRVFDEVRPDPTVELAARGAAVCREFRPELLLALGGGSSMDCAKAIRLAAEGNMRFLAIPTTSGSGSEVTSFSILTHGGVKRPLVDPALRPDGAILDDSLLAALPPSLIADTGMDLLAHCVEALGATGRSAFSDALALQGASILLGHLQASFGGDLRVRGLLHEAATMAGMAFDNAGLGLCHALAHALGGAVHLPHGRLCAMLLPHVMELNAEAALGQYAQLARVCGLEGATRQLSLRNLTAAIRRLRGALGMPATLRGAGTALADREATIQAALADPCCKTNPAPVTEEVVRKLLKAVEE